MFSTDALPHLKGKRHLIKRQRKHKIVKTGFSGFCVFSVLNTENPENIVRYIHFLSDSYEPCNIYRSPCLLR